MNEYFYDRLRWVLGKYIGVATTFHVPDNAAQELLIRSNFYKEIENNDYSHIFEEDELVIEDILGFKFGIPYYDTISLWAGEAYLYLFTKLEKPIDYLFLYIPIKKMKELFFAYHEMGWPALVERFEYEVNQSTLLSTLLKRKKISEKQLSILTGIDESIIRNYCLDDSKLFLAPYNHVYRLSVVLEAREEMFAKNIFFHKSEPPIKNKKFEKLLHDFSNISDVSERYRSILLNRSLD